MPEIGKYAEFYVAGDDLTPYFNAFEVPDEVGTVDTTCFGPTADETSMPSGVRMADLKAGGFYVQRTGELVDTALRAAQGAFKAASFAPLGSTAGYIAFLWENEGLDYNVKASVGDAIKTDLSAKANGAKRAGVSLHAKAARSGAYTGATYDATAAGELGASSTWWAHIHATIVTTDLTVLVETSADASTWVTLLTFTAITSVAGKGGERKTGTAAVHRYRRIRVTAGAGTFVVFLAAE